MSTLGPGFCPQVAQGLVSPRRRRAKTWTFDVISVAETPRKEQPALGEKRTSHRIWADGDMFTPRGEEGTGAEGLYSPQKGAEPGGALGVQEAASIARGWGKRPGRSCGWAKLLLHSHLLLQAVGGARLRMAESGVHWWLSGGIFKHRGARTERPMVMVFIKVQGSDDDRPELEVQIGIFQHVDLSDQMLERANQGL